MLLQIDIDDFDRAKAVSLTEAAKLMCGKGGKHPSVETLRRWANPERGCRPSGPDGDRIVLPTVRLGGELLTMPAWVEWFEQMRVRLGARTVIKPELPQTPGQRLRAQAQATARLDREGVRVNG